MADTEKLQLSPRDVFGTAAAQLGGECPAHRAGLNVTVTERRDGLECGHPGCTYQPGHLGAHSNEEEPS